MLQESGVPPFLIDSNSVPRKNSYFSLSARLRLAALWVGVLALSGSAAPPLQISGVIGLPFVQTAWAADDDKPKETKPTLTPSTPEQVGKAIKTALGDDRIKVEVVALPGDKYAAVLSGDIHPLEKKEFLTSVQQLSTVFGLKIVNRVTYTADVALGQVKKPDAENFELWPLTFSPSPLGTLEGANQYQVAGMVDALNKFYQKDAAKPPIQIARQGLLLYGNKALRDNIKRQLVLLDAPGPQVQLDVWAFQVSGKQSDKLETKLRAVWSKIERTQAMLRAVPDILNGAIAYRNTSSVALPKTDDSIDGKLARQDQLMMAQLRQDLKHLRFEDKPQGTISLNHALILLALEDRLGRDAILTAVEKEINDNTQDSDPWSLNKKDEGDKKDKKAEMSVAKESICLTYLRGEYGVSSKDKISDGPVYKNPLITEHEAMRSFFESIIAYQSSARGAQGVGEYRARLQARLKRIKEDPSLKLLRDYRELAESWDEAKKKPEAILKARQDPRFIGEIEKLFKAKDSGAASLRYLRVFALKQTLKELGQNPAKASQVDKDAALRTPEFRKYYSSALTAAWTRLGGNYKTALDKVNLDIFLDVQTADRLEKAPEDLRRTASIADSLLLKAVNAFTDDMKAIFMNPLTAEITKRGNLPDNSGVSLLGKSRLVVTSGLQSNLAPKMTSYVETTRPAPLSVETLNAAFPGTKSQSNGSSTNTTIDAEGKKATTGGATSSSSSGFANLTGAAQVLAGLNPAEAVLLAGALNPPTPTFTEVAPGVSILVRPAVMPDSSAARLQLDVQYGVDATAVPNTAAKNVLQWPVADSVKSHHMSTDAIVQAMDLFDISSFDITTSYPRPPGYIPVLGTLPVVGRVFQWRRKNTVLDHHSMILVNTVILPRALDVVQLYGATAP